MIISIAKTKTMAFWSKEPVWIKIVIDDIVIEQVSHFSYLGCDITFNYDHDIQKELHKLQYICDTLKKTIKAKQEKRHS